MSWKDGKKDENREGEREGMDLLSGESIGMPPTTPSLNTIEETKGITDYYSMMYSCYFLLVSPTCYLLQLLYNMRKNRNRSKTSNNSINKSYSINGSNNKPEAICER